MFGYRNIGTAVAERVLKKGWEISCIVRTDGVYQRRPNGTTEKVAEQEKWPEYMDDSSLAFLAISVKAAKDDGLTACRYLKTLGNMNIGAVTCEKGALSQYWAELEDGLDLIGYSAAVGGGTRFLRLLGDRRIGKEFDGEFHFVGNATMNYILDGVAAGRAIGVVVDEAVRLGYAEPGAQEPRDVLASELGDIVRKTAIVANSCHLDDSPVRANTISHPKLSEEDMARLLREAQRRRYIVSVTRAPPDHEDVIAGFQFQHGNWYVTGGFKRTDQNPLYHQLVPPGAGNAVLISEGPYGADGAYVLHGPGAGPRPTSRSMMIDADHLLERHI